MRKKLLIFACAFAMLLPLAVPVKAEAAGNNSKIYNYSNEIPDWPKAPEISSSSAVLIDADTGIVLYSKNPNTKHYPASITKILTALLAYENCKLDDVIEFSNNAVFGIPRDSNHIAIDVGEKLTVDEALNGLLIRSANEVAMALGEHIGGSIEGFAEMMNERAKELGAINSNFMNPSGLHNDNHYTTAYDMAMIGRAAFDINYLCDVSVTATLRIPASERQPDDIIDANKTLLLPGRKYEYEYLTGCKTGYTDEAQYTLVASAEKGGLKLIAVVLDGSYPDYYSDIISLFDYGFSNFEKIRVKDTDSEFIIDSGLFFETNKDILGNSKTFISLDSSSTILLPKTLTYEKLEKTIVYDNSGSKLGTVVFSHQGIELGSMDIHVNNTLESGEFLTQEQALEKYPQKKSFKDFFAKDNIVFINIKRVFFVIVGIVAALFLYMGSKRFLKNFSFGGHNLSRMPKRDKDTTPHYKKRRRVYPWQRRRRH